MNGSSYHIAIIYIAFLAAATGHAQHLLTMFDVDTSAFPTISAKIYALEADGATTQGLTVDDFELREDGVSRPILSLTCPPAAPPPRLSITLSIDISGSMLSGPDTDSPPIEMAKRTARNLIEAMPVPPSEIALQQCESIASIVHDFTYDRTALLDAIGTIEARGGNDFDQHLLNPATGLLNVAKRGAHDRIAILLTDAWYGKLTAEALQRCKDTCALYGIRFFAVIYSPAAAQSEGITASLRELAEATGGMIIDGVVDRDHADRVMRILQGTMSFPPCRIAWKSEPGCTRGREVSLLLPTRSSSTGIDYVAPLTSVSTLSVVPSAVSFGETTPGSYRDTIITVTAGYYPVTIARISGGNGVIAIDSGAAPPSIALAPGESHRIRLRFAPSDSGYAFTSFTVESDACSNEEILVSGGFRNHAPTTQSLHLLRPNGGELFAVGETATIEWEGVLPEDTVRLEYSVDGGTTWERIVDRATGLRYDWRTADRPSDRCLARVSQLGGEGREGEDRVTLIGHKRDVFGVTFNGTDGSVVTSSDDGTVRSWDAMTGALRFDQQVDTYGVRSIDIDPSGNRIVVAVGQSAYLLDAGDGTILATMSGHSSAINSVAFSADGSKIVTADNDGNVILRDKFGSQIETISLGKPWIRGVAISPDNRWLATGNGEIRDMATGAVVMTLSGYGGEITDIAYDPLGTRIVAACSDRTARIWDAATGLLLTTLTGHIDIVNSARFSPDGSRVVTASNDGTAIVWDATAGTPIRTLNGHRSVVHSARFSSDGRRIVTGGGDNIAIVWEPIPDRLQSDTSDALWSIVVPHISIPDIDFGRVLIGDARDSTLTAYICNDGNAPVSIETLTFGGSASTEFTVIYGLPPFRLAPGACHAVELRFRPGASGIRTATAEITTPGGVMTGQVRGEGIPPALEVVSGLVDFERVPIGSERDTTVEIVVRNIGPAPLSVSGVRQVGPDLDQFSVLDGDGSFTLMPGEGRTMRLRFAPGRPGRTSGSIAFDHDGVGSPATLALFGEGVCAETVETIVSAPGLVEAGAGEIVSVPIVLAPIGSPVSPSGEFTIVVSFDKTLLYPIDTAITITETDDTRTLALRAPRSASGDTICTLKFFTGFGDAESTPLHIETFEWYEECPVRTTTVDGLFRLQGICNDGRTTRLFRADGSIALKPAGPNPVGDHATIGYSLAESGHTRLYIVDLRGEHVGSLVDEERMPGEYRVEFDASGVPAGTYFYILETPTRRLVERMEIRR